MDRAPAALREGACEREDASAPDAADARDPDRAPAGASETAPAPTGADALVFVAEAFMGAPNPRARTGSEQAHLIVHLAEDPLSGAGSLAATLHDGTPLSPDAFRRLACDWTSPAARLVDVDAEPMDWLERSTAAGQLDVDRSPFPDWDGLAPPDYGAVVDALRGGAEDAPAGA